MKNHVDNDVTSDMTSDMNYQNCHVFKKIKTVYNRMISFIKVNNSGFTLVEAIITIVIVGIIVTPISMVFLGSLQDAIEAKEQLKANQMAQLFVVNIRI
ncbi:MAG: prepilin-type N-terminal cleavage/methylation domain-containing protein [Vallitaleaceae bacterium]|jgi:prepilin-type N-terminal cleavage/methylation domain-containing protein|nr:prepilin-type N-terminal cleavage/methylation domain-containing protein [Vallitaleaceae bacterium]